MATAAPSLLARGPWSPDQVETRWLDEEYEPPEEKIAAADEAISALRERGSPSHDGVAARLVSHHEEEGRLILELQPARWALRLVEGDASESVAALCVTRDATGRWLAGRRAPWLSSWPGRWALGAGGAVYLREPPAHTLSHEVPQEWSGEPRPLRCDEPVRTPPRLLMLVGPRLAPG